MRYVRPPLPRIGRRLVRVTGAACVALAAWLPGAGAVLAQAPSDTPVAVASDTISGRPLVDVSLGGLLRLRGEYVQGGDLGNGVSGLPSTLRDADGDEPAAGLGSTDMRLRFEPRVTIGSYGRMEMQIDVAGRRGFGATPAGDGAFASAAGFEGQGMAIGEALRVRRAWGELDLFGLGALVIGRTPDHFGLGLVRNNGAGDWDDFQTDVDRFALRGEAFNIRAMVARDVLASLPLTRTAVAGDQPYAVMDKADVIQWVFQVEGGQLDPKASGFHWAAALLWRNQEVGLALEHTSADPQADLAGDCLQTGDCTRVVPRDLSMFTPQGFVEVRERVGRARVHWQLEGALRYATLANTAFSSEGTTARKTVLSAAAATRLDVRVGRHTTRLDAGLATGEAEGGFGVFDDPNFVSSAGGGTPQQRRWLTAFRMHRGYRIDGLLFREVMGTVVNAIYARPAWRYWALQTAQDEGLEVEVAALAAMAMRPGGTPGGGRWIGVEPEAALRYAGPGGHGALAMLSWLRPGDALRAGANGRDPAAAWRVGLEYYLRF